jgi:hypothetical protein
MGYYKQNATVRIVSDRVFTGQRDPITCEPIFSTESVEVPVWLEYSDVLTHSSEKDAPQATDMLEMPVRGRFLTKQFTLNQGSYPIEIQTDFDKIEGILYINHYPKSVLGTGQYFGQFFTGIFKRTH